MATYGRAHRNDRAAWASHMLRFRVDCSRCGNPIEQSHAWDLDHINGGTHPAHRLCNERAGAQDGNAQPRVRPWTR